MTFRPLYVALVLAVLAVLAPATTATAAEHSVALSGRVLLPEGVDPTTVSLSAARRTSDSSWHTAAHASTSLAADATWTLSDLEPGEYRLGVAQRDGTIASRYWFPREGGRAGSITLAPGEARTGLELTVPLGATLSGTVDAPEGVETEHLWVTAHERLGDGTYAAAGHTGRVRPDGTWSVTQLFPGTYRVSVEDDALATWPAFHGGADLASARDVTVEAGGEASGIDLTLEVAGSVTGQVDLAAIDQESRRCVAVTAYARSRGEWEPVRQALVTHPAAGSTVGSYVLPRLGTASYRLGFADSCAVHDDRVTAATQFFPDALEVGRGRDVAVTDGRATAVEPFAVAPAGHLASYLSLYDRGRFEYLADRRVQLFRKSGDAWTVVAETRTSEAGGYWFSFIPAGQYRIGYAKGDTQLREVFHPSALTLAKSRTVTVPVGPRFESYSPGEAVTFRRDARVVLTSAPEVRGKARVGRTLRSQRPSYAQEGKVKVRRQWQLRRGGKVRAIRGATARKLTLTAGHRGAQVRLRVIATAHGHRRHVHRTAWSSPVR